MVPGENRAGDCSSVDMPEMNSRTEFIVYSCIFFKCWKSIYQHAYLHFLKEFNADPINDLFIYLFSNSQPNVLVKHGFLGGLPIPLYSV